jgi:hypothetical protein
MANKNQTDHREQDADMNQADQAKDDGRNRDSSQND